MISPQPQRLSRVTRRDGATCTPSVFDM
jgi:hypothetical protein